VVWFSLEQKNAGLWILLIGVAMSKNWLHRFQHNLHATNS
jgi:hypothetical protein